MLLVDRLISRVSPETALRRSLRLTKGQGVLRALALLTLAAKAGVPDAEYPVARCYLEGSAYTAAVRKVPVALDGAARLISRCLLSALCIRGSSKCKKPGSGQQSRSVYGRRRPRTGLRDRQKIGRVGTTPSQVPEGMAPSSTMF